MIICLEGMRFHALIGIHSEEKVLGNEIEVSIYITIDTPGASEDLPVKTLNYEILYETIKGIFNEKISMLETACSKILIAVSKLNKDVKKIRVRVAKLHPPLQGRVERVFVEDEWMR